VTGSAPVDGAAVTETVTSVRLEAAEWIRREARAGQELLYSMPGRQATRLEEFSCPLIRQDDMAYSGRFPETTTEPWGRTNAIAPANSLGATQYPTAPFQRPSHQDHQRAGAATAQRDHLR